MKYRILACVMSALATLLLSPHSARASKLESLVMPGPVIEGHAKWENNCDKCHQRFSKAPQRPLCLDCHDKVAADVRQGEGFHGRIPQIGEIECRSCHTEHVGRDADVVGLDPDTFDHTRTDFKLEGAHAAARCARCHEADKKYREAPHECYACHKEDDVHKGRLGETCGDCHDAKAWPQARFDHKDTDFPLADAHEDVACALCHPGEHYKHTPKECVACHRINDTHGGRYGDKCDTCHRPKKWDETVFDHDKDTKWALKGRHAKVACDSCHTKRLYHHETETECHGCHKEDDVHKGRYGDKCETCHQPTGWPKADFDHTKETDWPLKGKHEDVPCASCHRGDAYSEKLDTGCKGCHAPDDVHHGEQGDTCERCHDPAGWGEKVRFEHGTTRFPLIGLHAAQPCEACHLSARFQGAPLECVSCHEADDDHHGTLGPGCALCHNPNGWKLWRFDHDKQTDFKLDGAHEGLACGACHRTPTRGKVRQASACGACHMRDDVHNGGFGTQCDRCHTTKAFDEIRIGR
jgi:Cytochrome c3/Cytochrome c7 and related cytochrome c